MAHVANFLLIVLCVWDLLFMWKADAHVSLLLRLPHLVLLGPTPHIGLLSLLTLLVHVQDQETGPFSTRHISCLVLVLFVLPL